MSTFCPDGQIFFSLSYQHVLLVTYREVDLLIDPLKASNSQKQRVCTVVTHELAHQVGKILLQFATRYVLVLIYFSFRSHIHLFERLISPLPQFIHTQWFGNLVTMNWWDDLVRADILISAS